LQNAEKLNKSLSIYEESYQTRVGLTELLFTSLVCLKPFTSAVFLSSVVRVAYGNSELVVLRRCSGVYRMLAEKEKRSV